MVGRAVNEPTVKLDFGLSSAAPGLDPQAAANWPFKFNLIYSVTLNRDSLTTSIVAANDDSTPFDCQVLLHTYLRVKVLTWLPLPLNPPPTSATNHPIPSQDITTVTLTGLHQAPYIDKVDAASAKTETAATTTITAETDRVYTPADDAAVTLAEGGTPRLRVTRDNLSNVVVWNPWAEKAAGLVDFAPDDGYRQMVCVEPGAVGGWQSVEAGDAFEGAQTITLLK